MNFKCPKCGSTELEKVENDASVTTKIIGIDEDSMTLIYGKQENLGGNECFYACTNCFAALHTDNGGNYISVKDPKELINWLKKRNML